MADSRPVVAVIDIDGVLADVRHRLVHVRTTPKDWDAFFAAASQDPVLDEGRTVVLRLAEAVEIVYLSGRPERCRPDTFTWLRKHGLPEGPVLLRPHGDRRPASLVKVDALQRLVADVRVSVVVDDDPQVLEAVRGAGFDVLPADWMPREPALAQAQEDEGRT